MKKTILASVLALGFAASANAAIVPVTNTVTLPVSGNVTLGGPTLGGTVAIQYWEIVNPSQFDMPTIISYVGSLAPANAPLVWDIFADLDAAAGSADTGALLATGTIGGAGNPTFAVYPFLAGTNYVLKFSTVAAGTVANVSSVPVPAAAWLFGSALFGAGALRRKQQA